MAKSFDFRFFCLTSRVPVAKARHNTVDVDKASQSALDAWKADEFSQAPYTYENQNLVGAPNRASRRLFTFEEEKLMGFPASFTDVVAKIPNQSLRHREFRR